MVNREAKSRMAAAFAWQADEILALELEANFSNFLFLRHV
jgi:hypothetical protein